MLTNFKTVKQSIKRLKEGTDGADGSFERISKKEALGLQREPGETAAPRSAASRTSALPDAELWFATAPSGKPDVDGRDRLGSPRPSSLMRERALSFASARCSPSALSSDASKLPVLRQSVPFLQGLDGTAFTVLSWSASRRASGGRRRIAQRCASPAEGRAPAAWCPRTEAFPVGGQLAREPERLLVHRRVRSRLMM